MCCVAALRGGTVGAGDAWLRSKRFGNRHRHRLVLRLAVAELLDPDGPPTAVVIDEAVELAKEYSTDESGRFVNGVLSTVSAEIGLR